MTSDQISLVRDTWQRVVPIKEQAAELFYGKLFELDPSLRALFKADMSEQRRKLVAMLNAAVQGLSQLDALLPTVSELGRRHGAYGVQNEHYRTVGEALLWTLQQGLGEAFTPAARAAWAETYGVLADVMKAGAMRNAAA